MTMTIKSGSLGEFFDSVKLTAREIDAGKTPAPKHTVWMNTDDLAALLKPQRKALLSYLREQEEITLDELATALHRSAKRRYVNSPRLPRSGHPGSTSTDTRKLAVAYD